MDNNDDDDDNVDDNKGRNYDDEERLIGLQGQLEMRNYHFQIPFDYNVELPNVVPSSIEKNPLASRVS